MSETVREKGKIKLVCDGDKEAIEKFAKGIVEKSDVFDKDCYDSYLEALMDNMYDKYVIIGNKIYEILEYEALGTDCDFFDAQRNADGTISFHVMFYNGGCCTSEAIEQALKKLKIYEALGAIHVPSS